jgi:Fe-S oxidoreductase
MGNWLIIFGIIALFFFLMRRGGAGMGCCGGGHSYRSPSEEKAGGTKLTDNLRERRLK